MQFSDTLAYITDGGAIVVILLAMSVLMVTISIAKLIQFTLLRLWRMESLDRLVRDYLSGPGGEILARLRENANPVARLLVHMREAKERYPENREALEQEVSGYASEQIEEMRRGLRMIELIGMLSPLLGLLGTVLGMIEAFQALQVQGSQVDPSVLSGGIWVALLTTAAGLAVAVPAVAVHNFLEGMVEKTVLRMERAAGRALSTLGREGVRQESEKVAFLTR